MEKQGPESYRPKAGTGRTAQETTVGIGLSGKTSLYRKSQSTYHVLVLERKYGQYD